jgi:hypothetical protein
MRTESDDLALAPEIAALAAEIQKRWTPSIRVKRSQWQTWPVEVPTLEELEAVDEGEAAT